MPSARSSVSSAVTAVWAPRVMWIALGLTGMWSIGEAVDGRSTATLVTVTVCTWLLWGVGVVALMVPSVLGLTVARMLSALAVAVAVTSWASGAGPAAGATFLACTLVCAFVIAGAEFGHRCVEASAYGDERRFLLRPPAAFLPAMAVAGLAWTSAVIAAPLLLACGVWLAGIPVAIVAALSTVMLVPRFNALARRWLVFVPAGLVVHDLVVLGETLMIARADVEEVALALAGTEAADFTGPASGHAVEVSLRAMINALLAPTKAAPRGTALHVRSFIVAPSRPGAVVRMSRERLQRAMPPPST